LNILFRHHQAQLIRLLPRNWFSSRLGAVQPSKYDT
jgi:hypothetical protein